jgi:hypothetical protein
MSPRRQLSAVLPSTARSDRGSANGSSSIGLKSRCAGEHLTAEFIKEFLRRVWKDKISFVKLDLENPEEVPVNPEIVLNDDVSFKKAN